MLIKSALVMMSVTASIVSALAAPPVASSRLYESISAASPTVGKAISATDIKAAESMIGKSGAFKGTPVKVYSPKDHDALILDFAQNYKSALTAVAVKKNVDKFTGISSIVGKQVLVTGIFTAYKSHPEIMLTDPSQVKIIK